MVIGLTNLEVKQILNSKTNRSSFFSSLARSITNKDNTGSFITNPSKSNLSPWNLFCAYYIAQPSKINIS